MIDYIKMGKRIRNRRNELHMTQSSVAQQAGISASFLGHIERGSRVASLDTLLSICIALDVSMDYITGREYSDFSNSIHNGMTEDQRRTCRQIMSVLIDSFSS